MKLLLLSVVVIGLIMILPLLATPWVLYLAAASLLGWLLCGVDKFAAPRGLRRIPEDWLLIVALVGGTPGLLAGEWMFRHKTHKLYFNRALLCIGALQVLVMMMMIFVIR